MVLSCWGLNSRCLQILEAGGWTRHDHQQCTSAFRLTVAYQAFWSPDFRGLKGVLFKPGHKDEQPQRPRLDNCTTNPFQV